MSVLNEFLADSKVVFSSKAAMEMALALAQGGNLTLQQLNTPDTAGRIARFTVQVQAQAIVPKLVAEVQEAGEKGGEPAAAQKMLRGLSECGFSELVDAFLAIRAKAKGDDDAG